jgi:uncharacterized membrane protein YkoI
MKRRTRWIVGTAAVAALAGGGGGLAMAGVSDDDDGTEVSITGRALDRAEDAALDYTGQGRVTDTEVGDEESYYEVEVTLDNGKQTDVQLDRHFNVVGAETDSGEDDAGAGEDQ